MSEFDKWYEDNAGHFTCAYDERSDVKSLAMAAWNARKNLDAAILRGMCSDVPLSSDAWPEFFANAIEKY